MFWKNGLTKKRSINRKFFSGSAIFLAVIFLFLFQVVPVRADEPLIGFCADYELDPLNHFECERKADESWGEAGATFCQSGYVVDRFTCGGRTTDSPPSKPCGPYRNDFYCCLPCIPEETPDDALLRGEACGPSITAQCDTSQSLICSGGICIYSRAVVSLGGECYADSECIQQPYYGGFSPNTVHIPTACKKDAGQIKGTCQIVDGYCEDDDDCSGEKSICDLGVCVEENVPPPPPPEPEPEKGEPYDYCAQLPGTSADYSDLSTQRGQCYKCMGYWDTAKGKYKYEGEKIFTAVGCVRVSGEALAADLIKLLLGVGGGVALLSMLAAAFQFTISRGDSGKIKSAKELMTAAVSGLLFLIFSVIILQFIGVEILQIPGLG